MRRAAGRARKGSKPYTQDYTERGNCGISIEGAGEFRGLRGTLVKLLPRSCDEQQIYAHNECGGAWQHNTPSLPTARLGKHHLGLEVGTVGPIWGLHEGPTAPFATTGSMPFIQHQVMCSPVSVLSPVVRPGAST